MNEQQLTYQSYLVRIWYVDNDGETLWRATLENASTGERLGFSSVNGLLEYLEATVELMSQRAKSKGKRVSH